MTKFDDLPVCPKCGWHDGFTHARECNPAQGRAADRLAATLAPIPSTKLGYGYGRLTFRFDKENSITLAIDPRGHHHIDRFFCLRRERDTIVQIVRALGEILMPVAAPHVTMPAALTPRELLAAQGFPPLAAWDESPDGAREDVIAGLRLERSATADAAADVLEELLPK